MQAQRERKNPRGDNHHGGSQRQRRGTKQVSQGEGHPDPERSDTGVTTEAALQRSRKQKGKGPEVRARQAAKSQESNIQKHNGNGRQDGRAAPAEGKKRRGVQVKKSGQARKEEAAAKLRRSCEEKKEKRPLPPNRWKKGCVRPSNTKRRARRKHGSAGPLGRQNSDDAISSRQTAKKTASNGEVEYGGRHRRPVSRLAARGERKTGKVRREKRKKSRARPKRPENREAAERETLGSGKALQKLTSRRHTQRGTTAVKQKASAAEGTRGGGGNNRRSGGDEAANAAAQAGTRTHQQHAIGARRQGIVVGRLEGKRGTTKPTNERDGGKEKKQKQKQEEKKKQGRGSNAAKLGKKPSGGIKRTDPEKRRRANTREKEGLNWRAHHHKGGKIAECHRERGGTVQRNRKN